MKVRSAMVVTVVVAFVGLMSQAASAQTLTNNLFSQYETPPCSSSTTAGMYPAPHYVPGNVGGAYYTYQPLQPHEMMYLHSRKYYNVYAGPESFYRDQCKCNGGGSGLNVTTVVWQNGNTHLGPLPLSIQPLARFSDRLARARYCPRNGRFLNGGVRGRLSSAGCASGQCGSGSATGGCSAKLTDETNVQR